MAGVHRASPDPADLARLPGADFADAYTLTTPRTDLDPRAAARLMFEHQPAWVAALMRLRHGLVRPLGLKTSGPAGADLVGAFPVVAEPPGRLVLGFDDRHLDFLVVIAVRPLASGAQVTVSTLVRLNNLLGRAYLAAVMPFHVLIVRALLERLGAG